MQCLNPITMKNPANSIKTENEQGEKICTVKYIKPCETVKFVAVPCGKCNFCLKRNSDDWMQRLENEAKESDSAMFLGITYDEEHIHKVKGANNTLQATLKKEDLQKYIKKLRWHNDKFAKERLGVSSIKEARRLTKSIKYYAIGEYGSTTYRPHYHIIIFNLEDKFTQRKTKNDLLDEIWEKGQIDKGHGNGIGGGIAYCTRYLIKKETIKLGPNQAPQFAIISNEIGEKYVEKHKKWHIENLAYYQMKQIKGARVKLALAKYYKEKIFTKTQLSVQKSKEEKQRWQREDEEEQRLIKLGMNREQRVKYGIDQTMIAYKKITKNATKSDKL